MKDLRLQVVDSSGHTVVHNLDVGCSDCFSGAAAAHERKCPIGRGVRRVGKTRDGDCREFFICMQGGKKQHQFDIAMSTVVEAFTLLAAHSTEPEGMKVKRLIHDVSGVLGRNHFFALVPQNKLMEAKYEDQMRMVQDIQKVKPAAVCKTLIYLHKDNLMMTHLFTIYKVLDCDDKSRFEKKSHKIHSLLLNVLYLWRDDFVEKGVRVHVADAEIKVICDFNTIQAAFILFLDNAFKYTQSNSDMHVSFEENNDTCVAKFKMRSLIVEPEERTLIFEDEKRGKHACSRSDLRGQGFGMGRILRLVELNDGVFSANWGDKIDTSDYAENAFTFRLRLSKSGRRH